MSGETGCGDESCEKLQAAYFFESSSECIPPMAKLQGSEFDVDGVLMHVFMGACVHTRTPSLCILHISTYIYITYMYIHTLIYEGNY